MATLPSISRDPVTGCLMIKPCLETPQFEVTSPDNLTVYVSTTGDDSHIGGSPATAVLTLRRAIQIVNATGWNVSAQIRLLPGAYPISGSYLAVQPVQGAQTGMALKITGDSLTTAYAALSVLGVAGGGDVPWSLTLSAPVAATVDGGQARFLTGGLAGRKFVLGAASGSTVSIMYADAPPPAIGDVLDVLVPNVQLQPTGTLGVGSSCPVQIADLEFSVPQFPAGILAFVGGSVLFLNGVRFVPVPASAGSAVEFLGSSLWGIAPGQTPIAAGGPGVAFVGNSVSHNLIVFSPLGASIIANGTLVQDTSVGMQAGASLTLDQGLACRSALTATAANLVLQRTQVLGGTAAGVSADDGSTLTFARGDVSGCVGDGVYVRNSRLTLDTVASGAGPNGGVGLRLAEQAQARLNGSAGANTLSGAGGDVAVGANAAVSWATIAGVPASRSDFAAPSPMFSSAAL